MQKHSALALAAVLAATILGCGGDDPTTKTPTPDESGTPIEGSTPSEGEPSPTPSCKEDVTCGDPVANPDPESNPPKPKECPPSEKYREGMVADCAEDEGVVLTRDPETCEWAWGRAPEGRPIHVYGLTEEDLNTDCTIRN